MIKYIRIFAQVILSIIGTVFFAVIFTAVSPDMGKEFLNSMVGGIPIFDLWLDMLSKFYTFDLTNIANIYIQCFFQAIIMGICMSVCKKIANFFHVTRILPFGEILITFLALVIGFVLCNSIDGESGIALIALGLIVVYGLLLIVRSILPIHSTLMNLLSLKDILLILINSLVAVILTGYIAALALYMADSITLAVVLKVAGMTIISLLILYTVDGFGT